MQSLTLPRRASVKGLGKTLNIAIPVAIAALAASAAYACQTAFKRDPRSASKRDPLFG